MRYSDTFIKLEIITNPEEVHDDCILTKNYTFRGSVLHDLKQTLFDGGQTFYYRDDLCIYRDDEILVVGIEDDGQGVK